ncbi:MAG: PfkB family carbohydrate kinase [Anaerolineae bacterium]
MRALDHDAVPVDRYPGRGVPVGGGSGGQVSGAGRSGGRLSPRGLFVGASTLDVIHYVERVPGEDEKVFASDRLLAAGGPATTAAIAFADLGGSATLVSPLGSHPLAEVVRDELQLHGVRHVDLDPAGTSPPIVSAVTVTLGTGARSVVSMLSAHGGDAHDSPPSPAPPSSGDDLVAGADVVLIDGHQPDLALHVAARARESEVPVVLDGGSCKPGTAELLDYVDYAICSAVFRPPECPAAADVLRCLADIGVPQRAVTNGPQPIRWSMDAGRSARELAQRSMGEVAGGVAGEVAGGVHGELVGGAEVGRDGEMAGEIPVPAPGCVVDTLGAGDVLHGAFCFHLLTIPAGEFAASSLAGPARVPNVFPNALAAAAENAALSCTVRGARLPPRSKDAPRTGRAP